MAINPNTNFTAGAVLTADQQNRFPRGVVAYVQSTTSTTFAGETVQLTTSAFTAVANRYYRVTYYEPSVQTPAGATNYTFAYIRLTNISGTQLRYGQLQASGASQVANVLNVSGVMTFSAGSTVLVATLTANTGTQNAFRSATSVGYLLVEDIGPA